MINVKGMKYMYGEAQYTVKGSGGNCYTMIGLHLSVCYTQYLSLSANISICVYVLSTCQCVCSTVTLFGEKRLSLGGDLE